MILWICDGRDARRRRKKEEEGEDDDERQETSTHAINDMIFFKRGYFSPQF
jgi:hypothetical protein